MYRRTIAGMLALTGAVLAVGVTELFAPSYAHIEQSSLWAGRIPEEAEETADSRELLREGGQIVLLDALEGERKLPLAIPAGGEIRVEISDENRIGAELTTEEKEDGSTESSLRLRRKTSEDENIPGDTENGSKGSSGSSEPEGGSTENGTGSTETSTNMEAASGQLHEEVTELQLPKLNSQSSSGTPGDGDTKETEKTDSTGNTESSGENKQETPDNNTEPESPLTVTVTWTPVEEGAATRSATFQMAQRPEEGSGSFSISEDVTTYNQRTPIEITAGDAGVVLLCNGDGFPAMTRYTAGETAYLLYDKMPLTLSAGETVSLDLSGSGVSGDLILSAGEDSEKKLAYEELSVLDAPEKPVLLGKREKEVPIIWAEDRDVTTFTIERLERTDSGMVWTVVNDDSVGVIPDLEGKKLTLSSKDALAGTYRVSLIWQNEGVETSREIVPFYVFYAEGE